MVKKDKNKPKGSKSAYIFFSEEYRKELNKKGSKLSFLETSQKCGEKWKAMGEAQKKKYNALAAADKKRYDREMESYVPSEEDKKKQKKKKKEKDPNAPKKPMSAYFWYAKEIRPKIKAQNPDYKITDIAKVIGDKWGTLSSGDKAKYQAMANKDKARYAKEKEAYDRKKKK